MIESDADRAVFTNSDEFGVVVNWTVGVVAAAPFDAIFDNGTVRMQVSDGADALNREATLRFGASLLPSGAGASSDVVTVNAAQYSVKAIEPDGDGMLVVRLEAILS